MQINELTVAQNIVATLNATNWLPYLNTTDQPGESMGNEVMKVITTDDPKGPDFGITVGWNQTKQQISLTVKNGHAISTTLLSVTEVEHRWNQWPIKISFA